MYKLVVALTLTALLGGYAANAQTTGSARAPTTSMAPARDLAAAARFALGRSRHRQTKLSEVPLETPADLKRFGDEDRAIDRKLTICRGC